MSGEEEYEWSSKELHNAFYAMYHRHLAPSLFPTAQHIGGLGRMADRFFSEVMPQILDGIFAQSYDPFDVLNQKDFSKSKKLKYCQTILRQLHNLE